MKVQNIGCQTTHAKSNIRSNNSNIVNFGRQNLTNQGIRIAKTFLSKENCKNIKFVPAYIECGSKFFGVHLGPKKLTADYIIIPKGVSAKGTYNANKHCQLEGDLSMGGVINTPSLDAYPSSVIAGTANVNGIATCDIGCVISKTGIVNAKHANIDYRNIVEGKINVPEEIWGLD